jgi:hypothetical protein
VDRGHEAGIAEDADHPMVLGQHLGIEDRHVLVASRLRQMAEEDRPQPMALVLVGDRHADLGAVARSLPEVLSAAHHPFLIAEQRQDRQMVDMVDVDRTTRLLGDIDRLGPEPESSTLVGQADEVVLDAMEVILRSRTDVDGGAVSQDDVGLEVSRIDRAHPLILGRTGVLT